jgi:cell division protein FtsN
MSRDYKSRATRKQKKSLPGYVWLLSGLAIGLFVAFIIYLDKQPENDTDFGSAVQVELEKLKQQAKKKDTKKTEAVSDNARTEKKEQKFNFYTLLPELEVLIPENETRPPDTKNKTSDTSKKNKQYVLQVGSFQNLNDAEKLKANLAFLGLSANIQHVTVNKQAWHRVRTGPYKDKQQLYKNQKTLKRNNIHGIPMELK